MTESQNPNDMDLESIPMDSTQSQSPADSVFAEAANEEEVNPIGKLEAELQEARERELRSQAELENFRKRMTRDVEQQLRFANLPLVRDMLDIVDNLHRAIVVAEKTAPNDPLLEGVKLVHQQWMQVFAKYHCKPIDALGKDFDPNFHQAIAQSPSTEFGAGKVSLEASAGYTLHDRVIRPSQVIVSTGDPSQSSSPQ